MKVEFRGMGSYQGDPAAGSYVGGSPVGSYLVINYLARLEDGDGDASVAQYFLVYNPGTDTWRDAFNPGLPLLIPVTLDPRMRVEITEVFRYTDHPEVRTIFGGWAAATNLAGTEFDYTQLQPVPGAPGLQSLTMQGARELLSQSPGLLAAHELALAEARAAAERIGATGLVYLGDNPDGSVALAVFSPAAVTYSPQSIPFAGVLDVPTLEIP